MTKKEEKVNQFFEKFKTDFDAWDCNDTDKICKENRLTLLRTKHLPKHESELVRDLYAAKCDQYSNSKQ